MKTSILKPTSIALAGLAMTLSMAVTACGGGTVEETAPEATEEAAPVEEEAAPEGEETEEGAE